MGNWEFMAEGWFGRVFARAHGTSGDMLHSFSQVAFAFPWLQSSVHVQTAGTLQTAACHPCIHGQKGVVLQIWIRAATLQLSIACLLNKSLHVGLFAQFFADPLGGLLAVLLALNAGLLVEVFDGRPAPLPTVVLPQQLPFLPSVDLHELHLVLPLECLIDGLPAGLLLLSSPSSLEVEANKRGLVRIDVGLDHSVKVSLGRGGAPGGVPALGSGQNRSSCKQCCYEHFRVCTIS